jgi:homoaconitate hydratase
MDAGAIRLPPGCGACIGLGEGTLDAGEVGISATNRNFKGRMGSRDSFVYLASPLVVAASAIAGKIASPDTVAAGGAQATERRSDEVTKKLAAAARCREIPRPAGGQSPKVEILAGFPTRLEGELLLIPKDNLNTDGIYGKDYTYKELPPDEMAKVAMENYDPAFQQIAREGDILVGGYNFGSGSSREQAATALKYRGLQMIIAGSFSQTYKRNAFNNGYVCIECPQLVDDLRAAYKDEQKPTIRSGWQATVDFTKSRIAVRDQGAGSGQREYSFSPLGTVAQELVVKGGFEAVIRDQLATL